MNICAHFQQFRFDGLQEKRSGWREPTGPGFLRGGRAYFTRSMNVRSTVFTRIFCPASM